ncbi:MAG: DUF2891 family protein [Caulobacterales bacterium]|nr:DUF2891 family protein [Caulobacterales bacterium]
MLAAALLAGIGWALPAAGQASFDELRAQRGAVALALTEPIAACVRREDTRHPVFHGCVDWHSATHATWALIAFGLMTGDERHRALVEETLDPDALAAELADVSAAPAFEMPYGRAWFLRLAADYARAGGDDRLDALTEVVRDSLVARYEAQAPRPAAPEYASDAWALVNLIDFARKTGDVALEARVEELTRAHFMADGARCPLSAETDGFIAVCVTWAWLVSKVAGEEEFAAWFADWDPGLADLTPVERFPTAHDYGRNFSRAWAFHDLYRATGDERLLSAYTAHLEAGYRDPERWNGDYMRVAHWVAQFGMLALEPLFAETSDAVFEPVRAAYPEGPTVREGDVYWAEMNTHRVRRWRGGTVETVLSRPGCGPTAVETAPEGGFWVICHLADRLLRVDGDFAVLFEATQDVDGLAITNPNDATPDGRGGVYVTSAGLFALSAPASGRVLHVSADGRAEVVLSGLRYANGIAFDQAAGRFFVSEHLERRVWRVDVPGEEGGEPDAQVHFDLAAADLAHAYDQAGPDGLLLAPDGGLLVAEYGEGRILHVTADGELAAVLPAPAPFVTNLAFAPWSEDVLIVTASKTNTERVNEGVVATVRWR